PDGSDLLRVWKQASALFQDNFPYFTCALPVMGGPLLWKRDRTVAGGLVLVFVSINLYNLFYKIDDIAAYYLTSWMAAAALLAVALDEARSRAPRLLRGQLVASLLVVMMIGVPLARNWRASDLSRATWVRDFAQQKLVAADPDCVLITFGDDDINPIWYLHDVMGVRPDVTPIDRAWAGGRTWGLYDWDPSLWYLHRLRRQGVNASMAVPADPAARDDLARDGYLIGLLERELRHRPLCVT